MSSLLRRSRLMPHPIVIVACWGSSCRSPMAKALIERAFREASLDVEVQARALHQPALAAASEAVECMAARGLDIAGHRPTAISDVEVELATIILVMDRSLLLDAEGRWPAQIEKIHRLMDFATGEASDVKALLVRMPARTKSPQSASNGPLLASLAAFSSLDYAPGSGWPQRSCEATSDSGLRETGPKLPCG